MNKENVGNNTKEYYSAPAKPGTLSTTMTQMELEVMIATETCQIQQNKYHMISLMCNLKKKGDFKAIKAIKRIILEVEGRREG